MCGINGYADVAPGGLSGEPARAMNAALLHRGPDEGGVLDCGFAWLSTRRLSIVDLAGGHQPLRSSDGRLALVYNGELYQADEMRARLRALGYEFGTRCDTEVLLDALHAWDLDALPRLNGMYAFAAVDARERSVLLARDPIGIKPLYWWHGPRGELVFSSELQSLVAHPWIPRKLDRRSLAMLLVDRYVADPWTLFEGVRQLPPGHWLRWKDGRVELGRHARFELEPRAGDEEQALRELQDALAASVRSQLAADVPVGVWLSGGIDSSSVAALAARARREAGGARVATFCVGFSSASHDESALARTVARHIDSEHHELRVEDARFDPAVLQHIVEHVGQPLGDTSCIPTYLVSRLAREHVKVVLSGDGGDELFGGYDHMFWTASVQRLARRAPSVLRRLARLSLAHAAPLAFGPLAQPARRARKGLDLSFHAPLEQFRRMRALWTPEEAAALLVPLGSPAPRAELLADAFTGEHLSPEEYAMAVLAQTYLPGAILTKVDRMSMAASLEVRVPLLDERVLACARRLPLSLKVRGRTGKYLLRRACADLLPDAVYRHKKHGFAIPLFEWLNDDFWNLLEDLYRPGTRAAALFEPRLLRATMAQGRAARERRAHVSDHAAATRVWLLAQIALWLERFEVAT